MANILYLGDSSPSSTSAHRANALTRLGHAVVFLDPYKMFSKQLGSRWLSAIHFRTGYRFLNSSVVKWLERALHTVGRPDVVWVNSGELFGPHSLKILRRLACPIILYNNDDPTGKRDGRRFDLLLQALPYYDLCAVMREINIPEFKARGAKDVLRVFMSYDEEIHQPFAHRSAIPEALCSDVAFIGTWMRYEKRDEFLLELIRQGVPVSIWGNRWEKSPYFYQLAPHWRGSALDGQNYVAAIQGAKICLGLLSKGNRDLHTRRSLEVPSSGGLFCAERTAEHQALYEEGYEAVFWSDPTECADVCTRLLHDKRQREKIRKAGMNRVRELKLGNEDICNEILTAILGKHAVIRVPAYVSAETSHVKHYQSRS